LCGFLKGKILVGGEGMKKLLLTAIVFILVIVSGCSNTGSTGTQENDSPSGEGNTVISTDDSPDTTVDTVVNSAQEISETTDTITEETASSTTESSEMISSTGETAGEEETALYLSRILPIVQRHNRTRETLTEAENTFTLAMPPTIDHIEDYCLALSTAKPLVKAEYDDACAITPPGALSGFHNNFHTAISKYNEYITNFLNYYEEVLETGTSDLSYYEKGNNALMEANRLWWNSVVPEIDKMLKQ